MEAEIDSQATVGAGTTIWPLAQIREGVIIGANCSIGRGVYIGPRVTIGSSCKIQNNALIYDPACIEDGVFIGPAVVLTNDRRPRAVDPMGEVKRRGDWEAVGVVVEEGAAIGAASVCVAPVRIGRWALIGAGSVVTRDVPAHALVRGNPARFVFWVGRDGRQMAERGKKVVDLSTGHEFVVREGALVQVGS